MSVNTWIRMDWIIYSYLNLMYLQVGSLVCKYLILLGLCFSLTSLSKGIVVESGYFIFSKLFLVIIYFFFYMNLFLY